MTGIIDTHHHFWLTTDGDHTWTSDEHSALAGDYTPDDFRPLMQANSVEATVLVQSVNKFAENDRLTAFARQSPEVRGIVGYLPLSHREQALAELARSRTPMWCGVRCLSDDESLAWALSNDALDVFRHLADSDLSWDVVIRTRSQAETVARVSSIIPSLRVVVDHLGAPPLDARALDNWLTRVQLLSQLETVSMKVSLGIAVLTPWNAWSSDVLDDRIGRVLELFPPDRLMFASNWPVSLIKAPYSTVIKDTILALSKFLSGADLDATLRYSAINSYQLKGFD